MRVPPWSALFSLLSLLFVRVGTLFAIANREFSHHIARSRLRPRHYVDRRRNSNLSTPLALRAPQIWATSDPLGFGAHLFSPCSLFVELLGWHPLCHPLCIPAYVSSCLPRFSSHLNKSLFSFSLSLFTSCLISATRVSQRGGGVSILRSPWYFSFRIWCLQFTTRYDDISVLGLSVSCPVFLVLS